MATVSPSRPTLPEKVVVDDVAYEVADPRSVVDIDGDLPEHAGRWPSESWFVVSNLDSHGQRIGLQVHFLLQRLPTGDAVVQLNVVVVNEALGTSRAMEYIYPLDQVEISADRMHLSAPELEWTGGSHGCTLKVEGKDAQIDITTTTASPPLLMNGQGQFPFLGEEQYEFALPAMPTTGTVTLDSEAYEVTGASWLDRQWGGLPEFFAGSLGGQAPNDVAPSSPMNWMWSNPQLDNGVNVALVQLRDMVHGKIYLALTAVHPDGTHIVVPQMEPVEASEYWTSPATGRRYPTRCIFRAPQIDTELIVEVPYKEQEIVSSEAALTKFEGSATVSGTYQGKPVSGFGYLELVGDWS